MRYVVATKIARFIWIVLVASSLAACGGGSSGGGGGSPNNELSFTLSTQSMTFSSRAPGIDPPSQYITATVPGAATITGTMYFVVVVEGPAVRSVGNINIDSQSTARGIVFPQASSTLGPGTHTSTIRVTACAGSPDCSSGQLRGSPQVINVTYTIDTFQARHKLLASETGVAFTSLPSLSRLTRTLQVTDSQGHSIPWSATADQTWLSVTSTGITPGDLLVTADPTGLASDTIHYANVSITADESGLPHNEIVRVGLWVGATDPDETTIVASSFERVIADPIRPLVYAHNGGTSLFVYNVFTGERLAEVPVGRLLGDLAVAPDGSRLFAGTAGSISSSAITPIDLSDYSLGAAWRGYSIGPSYVGHLEYVRIDGAGLILAGGGGKVFNPETGVLFTTFGGDSDHYNDTLAASADGKRLCSLNRGLSPNKLTCYRLQYTDIGGDLAVFEPAGSASTGISGKDLVISRDGSRIYVAASGQQFDVLSFGSSTFSHLAGDHHTNNIEIAPDGRIFGGASVSDGPTDVWVYSASETLQRQTRIAGYARGLLDGSLKLSSDGLRMIALTNDPKMQFMTVAP